MSVFTDPLCIKIVIHSFSLALYLFLYPHLEFDIKARIDGLVQEINKKAKLIKHEK